MYEWFYSDDFSQMSREISFYSVYIQCSVYELMNNRRKSSPWSLFEVIEGVIKETAEYSAGYKTTYFYCTYYADIREFAREMAHRDYENLRKSAEVLRQ